MTVATTQMNLSVEMLHVLHLSLVALTDVVFQICGNATARMTVAMGMCTFRIRFEHSNLKLANILPVLDLTKVISVLKKHALTSNSHARKPDIVYHNLGFAMAMTVRHKSLIRNWITIFFIHVFSIINLQIVSTNKTKKIVRRFHVWPISSSAPI